MIELLKNNQALFLNEQVSFAYLYGSVAQNSDNKMSDIDIAVYFSDKVPPDLYLDKRFNLMIKLNVLLKKEVDVLVLNDRSNEIVLEVLKFGNLIFEQDPSLRINFRYQFTRKYLDFLPYREYYFNQVLNRIKIGKDCDARSERHQDSIEKIRRIHLHP